MLPDGLATAKHLVMMKMLTTMTYRYSTIAFVICRNRRNNHHTRCYRHNHRSRRFFIETTTVTHSLTRNFLIVPNGSCLKGTG